MASEVRDDRRYVESHEWAKTEDGSVRIGISDFAQDELGDIVYVELPDVGDEVTGGEPFGVVESIKAVSDVYAPVSGTVLDRNDDLFDQPELLNEAPYDDGWMIEVEPADADELASLLSPEDYADQLA
ncbi:MAG: glycine cleavage system protein GcvH [Halobacteriales archaeon]